MVCCVVVFWGVLVCLCVVPLFRKGVCAFVCELLGDVVCCLCARVCLSCVFCCDFWFDDV